MSQNNMNSTISRICYKRDERKQNLVRNQIDYIKKRIEHKRFKTNSRSCGVTKTETNHKGAKMEFNFEWFMYILGQNKSKEKVDHAGFYD